MHMCFMLLYNYTKPLLSNLTKEQILLVDLVLKLLFFSVLKV